MQRAAPRTQGAPACAPLRACPALTLRLAADIRISCLARARFPGAQFQTTCIFPLRGVKPRSGKTHPGHIRYRRAVSATIPFGYLARLVLCRLPAHPCGQAVLHVTHCAARRADRACCL